MTFHSSDGITSEEKGTVPAVTVAMPSATCTATVSSQRQRLRTSDNIQKFVLLAESNALQGNSSGNKDDLEYGIPRGCQFSPDGTCLLTARSNILELYNTPYGEEEEKEGDIDNDNNSKSTSNSNKQDWTPEITYNSGESVRAYAWYPHMKSSDSASCCFLGVSRDSPVHLYDAYDGSIRATYRPYNALDEMESPTTLCFVENGQKLVTGGLRSDRILHVFDINRPGRDHSEPLLKLGKTRRSKDGQKGLVSTIAYSEGNGVIAVGTYSPGSIYLYDLRAYSRSAVAEIVMSSSTSTSSGGTVCVVGHGKKGKKNKRKRFTLSDDEGSHIANKNDDCNTPRSEPGVENPFAMNFSAAKLQWYQSRTRGGVTQLQFSDDHSNKGTGGHYLFSASRRSNAILQWDLRKLSSSSFCPGIASFEVDSDTNQRIEFQLYGDQIWTGGRDGCVRVYSHGRPTAANQNQLLTKIEGFPDSVNGISLHPDVETDSIHNSKRSSQLERLFSMMDDGGDGDCGECADLPQNSGIRKSLLAVAIGSRHFPSENDWENEKTHETLSEQTTRSGGFTQVFSLQ